MRRDPRARSPKGTSVAAAARAGADLGGVANTVTSHHGRNCPDDTFAVDVASTIRTRGRSANVEDTLTLAFSATQDPTASLDVSPLISSEPSGGVAVLDGPARCITARRGRDGASSDQTFAVVPIQEAQRPRANGQNGMGVGAVGDPMYTCTTRGDHAVFAFDERQITHPDNRATAKFGAPSPTIGARSNIAVAGELRPRRLTPMEVERCFGFADGYTAVRGSSDSARYEALGNSMAVPVVAWIGRRLQVVDGIVRGQPAGGRS